MDEKCPFAVGFMEKPYKVIKVDSGGIRFSITALGRYDYVLQLLKKKCPHEAAYKFCLSETSALIDVHHNEPARKFKIPDFYNGSSNDFCLTWFNDEICLGIANGATLLRYPEVNTRRDKMIGFVKFEIYQEYTEDSSYHKWNVECTPLIYAPMTTPKKVNGGELRWVQINSNDTLPIDALIGGFEDEPLYIARATHRGSLCPGKYVKSKQSAFIPWGHAEIAKNECEVLCGYDAIWVKSKSEHIPENAFIGGHSEVHHEPLLIGRGWIDNHLVVGKVHLLYKTCYLPYREKEVETSDYETLVIGNKERRSESINYPCHMKMIMQPCI